VRRFALAIVVALLAFGASGASALVLAEPCDSYEHPGRDEGSCPPTCVTCGCCAQAVEPVTLAVTAVLQTTVAAAGSFIPRLPAAAPRDILHVPKPRIA
jgi:hypothetical protein